MMRRMQGSCLFLAFVLALPNALPVRASAHGVDTPAEAPTTPVSAAPVGGAAATEAKIPEAGAPVGTEAKSPEAGAPVGTEAKSPEAGAPVGTEAKSPEAGAVGSETGAGAEGPAAAAAVASEPAPASAPAAPPESAQPGAASSLDDDEPPAIPKSELRGHKMVLTGVGLLGLGVASYVAMGVSLGIAHYADTSAGYLTEPGEEEEHQEQVDRRDAARGVAIGVGVTAGVSLAVGLALVIVGRKRAIADLRQRQGLAHTFTGMAGQGAYGIAWRARF